jgi:hypothetical protein
VSAIAGLVAAVTGLILALGQIGIFGTAPASGRTGTSNSHAAVIHETLGCEDFELTQRQWKKVRLPNSQELITLGLNRIHTLTSEKNDTLYVIANAATYIGDSGPFDEDSAPADAQRISASSAPSTSKLSLVKGHYNLHIKKIVHYRDSDDGVAGKICSEPR